MAYRQPRDSAPPYDAQMQHPAHTSRPLSHQSDDGITLHIPHPQPTGPMPSTRPDEGGVADRYRDPYTASCDSSAFERAASSVGPWDSASQRNASISSHHIPTSVPLSDAASSHHLRNKTSQGGLSYIDEEGAYYRSDALRPASAVMDRNDVEMRGLMGGAADMGRYEEEGGPKVKFTEYQESPYPYPPASYYREPSQLYSRFLFPTGLDRLLALVGIKAGQTPLQQAIERKKRGIGGQRWPVAAWSLAVGK